ncbi:MAG TPA: Rieske 2Fe-2S domain-containing protein [Bryobacteraceae bacterium]|nr:Rieske 2Fe-2S domain-containing protein [Bryobacteraceae bacterium]
MHQIRERGIKMPAQGAVGVIARQEWMRPLEEKLQDAIHCSFTSGGANGQKVKNFLHGTWIGHPLHVILTDVPIGAWTAAMVFDVLDSMSRGNQWQSAANGAIAIGLAGAAGAAIAGLTDWQNTDPPARRIGLTHGLLNVGGVTLFASSLAMRKRNCGTAGRALSILGYAVATVAARLGGNMVYEQRVGVDHTSGQTLPDEFVSVLADSDLAENQPRRVQFQNVPILLVRRNGSIFALAETCSHMGGPLSEGKLIDQSIKCPWHGSRFALEDGRVLDGPAVHPQPCLEARVANGQIEIRKRASAA